jgi:G:T-mismatch repair DNA endonuclease (very short patch repair protein)
LTQYFKAHIIVNSPLCQYKAVVIDRYHFRYIKGREMEIKQIIIWECELKESDKLKKRLLEELK